MTDYEKQGIKFLKRNRIKMECESLGHRTGHFGKDDNTERHIVKVTFSRIDNKKNQFSLDFGMSINDSFKVINGKFKMPTAYDVLACLTKYDPETFDDFCANFGYNNDSRADYATYEAVREEWYKVKRFFSNSELEELQEIN